MGTTTNTKLYYMICTQNEKVWIYADGADVSNGVLSLYDVSDDDKSKVIIAAFGVGYWTYFYEADPETGDSIQAQIPYWKRHVKDHQANYEGRRGLPQRQEHRTY